MAFEALSNDRVLNKNIFMQKLCREYAQKASPRALFHFGK